MLFDSFRLTLALFGQADEIMKIWGVWGKVQYPRTQEELTKLLKMVAYQTEKVWEDEQTHLSIWEGDTHVSYHPSAFMAGWAEQMLRLMISPNEAMVADKILTIGRFTERFNLVVAAMEETDRIRRVLENPPQFPQPAPVRLSILVPRIETAHVEERAKKMFAPLLSFVREGKASIGWPSGRSIEVTTSILPEEFCRQVGLPAAVKVVDDNGERILYNLDGEGNRIKEYAPDLRKYLPS